MPVAMSLVGEPLVKARSKATRPRTRTELSGTLAPITTGDRPFAPAGIESPVGLIRATCNVSDQSTREPGEVEVHRFVTDPDGTFELLEWNEELWVGMFPPTGKSKE